MWWSIKCAVVKRYLARVWILGHVLSEGLWCREWSGTRCGDETVDSGTGMPHLRDRYANR